MSSLLPRSKNDNTSNLRSVHLLLFYFLLNQSIKDNVSTDSYFLFVFLSFFDFLL